MAMDVPQNYMAVGNYVIDRLITEAKAAAVATAGLQRDAALKYAEVLEKDKAEVERKLGIAESVLRDVRAELAETKAKLAAHSTGSGHAMGKAGEGDPPAAG